MDIVRVMMKNIVAGIYKFIELCEKKKWETEVLIGSNFL